MRSGLYHKNMHQLRIDLNHVNGWVVLDLLSTMDKFGINHDIPGITKLLRNFYTKYGIKLKI